MLWVSLFSFGSKIMVVGIRRMMTQPTFQVFVVKRSSSDAKAIKRRAEDAPMWGRMSSGVLRVPATLPNVQAALMAAVASWVCPSSFSIAQAVAVGMRPPKKKLAGPNVMRVAVVANRVPSGRSIVGSIEVDNAAQLSPAEAPVAQLRHASLPPFQCFLMGALRMAPIPLQARVALMMPAQTWMLPPRAGARALAQSNSPAMSAAPAAVAANIGARRFLIINLDSSEVFLMCRR